MKTRNSIFEKQLMGTFQCEWPSPLGPETHNCVLPHGHEHEGTPHFYPREGDDYEICDHCGGHGTIFAIGVVGAVECPNCLHDGVLRWSRPPKGMVALERPDAEWNF